MNFRRDELCLLGTPPAGAGCEVECVSPVYQMRRFLNYPALDALRTNRRWKITGQSGRSLPCLYDGDGARWASHLLCSGLISARHQYCKNDRKEKERRHIAYQMTAFGGIADGLHAHDRGVNHARPHGEPDQTLVRIGISRCDKQKYAERGVHSKDHRQIVRVSLSPSPA